MKIAKFLYVRKFGFSWTKSPDYKTQTNNHLIEIDLWKWSLRVDIEGY